MEQDKQDKFDTEVDDKELDAAKAAAAKESIDVYTRKLNKPLEYNGKRIESLTFNFGVLTGDDGLEIENEMASMGKVVVVPALSGEYMMRMCCRACQNEKIGVDAFKRMSLADYNSIRSKARSFLLRSE